MGETNLFLIQGSQDKEQTLEEIQQKLAEKKRIMGSQIEKPQQSIAELDNHIKEEQEKYEELRQQALKTHGASERDQLIEELTNKIIEVHQACGHDTEHHPNPNTMLKVVESKLEEYLAILDEEEYEQPDRVDALMRKQERVRRDNVKIARKFTMERKQAERLETSLLRSQQPIHKKVGKQLMFKSPPLVQAKKIVVEDEGFEEAAKEHGLFEVWIDRKDGTAYGHAPAKEEQ